MSILLCASVSAQPGESAWNATWGSAQTAPYGAETLPADTLNHTTLRQVVRVSASGSTVRLRLSNAFGESPLVLTSVRIAPGRVDASAHTVRLQGAATQLAFAGRAGVSIPMGAEYLSDPVAFPLSALSDLVVDMDIAQAPATLTLHAGAHATSYWVSGSHAGEPMLTTAQSSTRWYFLSSVEIKALPQGSTAVTLGDSITDGHASTTDANDRWPDDLARRLQADPRTAAVGVVNAGIGGNRLLADGIGPDALSRFDRDVLARPGVRYLVILEGVNDLGTFDREQQHSAAEHAALVAALEQAFTEVVAQAHAHGILVYGGTITPFAGNRYYHPDPAELADRAALNHWILSSGTFDATIDFDAVMRDPAHPEQLLPAYDSGDHLHPGPEGYRRMAGAAPLELFTR